MIERLSPPPTSPAISLAQLQAVCKRGEDAQPLYTHAAAAEAWLEAKAALICQPAAYRLTTPDCRRLALRLPIGPATALTRLTHDVVSLPGWRIKNGLLLRPLPCVFVAGATLTFELMAGFPPGELPHLVRLSLLNICRHWRDHDADRTEAVLGDAHASVDQFLIVHRPKFPREATWL